jgi:hypothetical protein
MHGATQCQRDWNRCSNENRRSMCRRLKTAVGKGHPPGTCTPANVLSVCFVSGEDRLSAILKGNTSGYCAAAPGTLHGLWILM